MARRRSLSRSRDHGDLLARAVLAVLVASLLTGLLLPIYTDEVAWRMMLSRAPLDGGVDRGLGDQCGANATRAAPLFMQPMRHLSAWMATHLADPRAVRITGVALALVWVALFWRLAQRLPADLVTTGRTIGLALMGLGVLPFLMVWSRPEQPLLLGYTLAAMVALAGGKGRGRAWAAAGAIVVIGIVTLGYHPKAVVFLPILIVACALSSRGREGRLARIAGIAVLVGCAAVAFGYWTARFACPGDPVLAAMLARENVASAIDPAKPFDALWLVLRTMLPWRYVNLTAPSTDYMSDWLVAAPIPPEIGGLWQRAVKWLWRGAIYVGIAILLWGAISAIWRRKADASLVLGLGIAVSVAAWSATQINKNAYESALQLPLIALALVLALPVLGARVRRVAAGCAAALAVLSITSQLLLLGFYAPAMARIAARPGPIAAQPYSYVPWGYPELRSEIRAAAEACAIDPARARHLLVDDMTYFPLMQSWRPLHRMAHVDVWRGAIGDPLAYLRAHGASGGVVACAYLPPEMRARAKAIGRFCCLGPWKDGG